MGDLRDIVDKKFTLPAPGKLNLCLNILGRRPDGYHELQTAFQIISIADSISFELADSIEVICDIDIEPHENLVYRAAKSLLELSSGNIGAKLSLKKNLPVGAGLGGGSSDAATTLVGLNYLWQLGLNSAELRRIGAVLGADVPLFVFGHSAWAEGIGEKLSVLQLPDRYFLILIPGCSISSAEIFRHSDLTRDSSAITIARFLEYGSGNDCEAIARKLYPEVDEALLWLNKWGPAKMTGTGSCVFLAFESMKEAELVQKLVPAKWAAFVSEGLNDSPLLEAVDRLN